MINFQKLSENVESKVILDKLQAVLSSSIKKKSDFAFVCFSHLGISYLDH